MTSTATSAPVNRLTQCPLTHGPSSINHSLGTQLPASANDRHWVENRQAAFSENQKIAADQAESGWAIPATFSELQKQPF